MRDAAAGACRLLQRLRYRSTGASQGVEAQGGRGLTTAGPEESIVPGFDTPVAGEQPAGRVRMRAAASDETVVDDESGGSKDPRDRFYDEEEGRP